MPSAALCRGARGPTNFPESHPMNSTCPYYHQPAQLVTGTAIYPRRSDLANMKFHQCAPCDAYVGTHKAGAHMVIGGKKVISDGTLPLGRLANPELRRAKQAAHAAFDPIWQSRTMGRKQAYAWLAKQLRLKADEAHIGEFDVAQCGRVVEVCEQFHRGEA